MMDNIRYLTRNWYMIPKGFFRLCFILINNAYSIPTYVIWMILLSPLRKINADFYWRIEGYFFHWLLAIVSTWSWSAGYDVMEVGDDISECLDDRTLIIANHQATGDVPLLMACFNAKKQILPNIMWIMDSLFKYTNFGIVSVLHQDFFIMSGRDNRDVSLRALAQHLLDSYIPRKRKWMVLFPEGGFLRKRKAVSQRFAEKNNFPPMHHVTLPRTGAMQVILDTLGPKSTLNNNSNLDSETRLTLKWILDITICYPDGQPIDLGHIVFGHRDPCQIIVVYRLYECKEVPEDANELTQWLYDRWYEKERFLESFYKTGTCPLNVYSNKAEYVNKQPQVVVQDYLRFTILHIFFIVSTYIHLQMFYAIYEYCHNLIY